MKLDDLKICAFNRHNSVKCVLLYKFLFLVYITTPILQKMPSTIQIKQNATIYKSHKPTFYSQ